MNADRILHWAISDKDGKKEMRGNGELSEEVAFLIKKFNMEEELRLISHVKILERDYFDI